MKNFVFKHKLLILTLPILAVTLLLSGFLIIKDMSTNSPDSSEMIAITPQATSPELAATPDPEQPDITVIAEDLYIPWELTFLPDSSGNFPETSQQFLVTERDGRIIKISSTERKTYQVSDVRATGEGGLLGLAIHPDFHENHFIYVYFTTANGNRTENKVERYTLEDALTNREVIIDGIPGSSNHNGGRIAFGPDGFLYITTGDAQDENLAQDTNSLAGKILRIEEDGSIPVDNPFDNAVYSYGHRNIQGLTWDSEGRLWATEHGRSGIRSGFDELNLIQKGVNYGWPIIQGDETKAGMKKSIIHSGAADTWAPSGITYFNNSLFFTGLRGQALYQAKLDENGETVNELIKHFDGTYGRIRTVNLGPDGYLYILTNNTDGRGTPQENDDKLIRVNFGVFE